MKLSYPELQAACIRAYFTQGTDLDKGNFGSFVDVLFDNLVEDKWSRKDRFLWVGDRRKTYTETELAFLEKRSSISRPEVVLECLQKISKLAPGTRYFVEKTYYMLDELISWAKHDGNNEILAYAEQNPEILKKAWPPHVKCLTTTHMEHDLEWRIFDPDTEQDKKRLEHVLKYCKQYRAECYDLYRELRATT